MATDTTSERAPTALRPAVGRAGFFTLALGAVVGSGWVIVLGEWLRDAGPGGAVIGFLLGGLSMVCIGLCYGELAAQSSRAGGEFLYTLETFGPLPGFMVGWFLVLFAASICAFEAIVVGSLIRALIPDVQTSALYTVAGSAVTVDTLATGIVGTVAVGSLHYRGAAVAIRFQNIVTYGFLLLMVVLVCTGIALGRSEHLRPWFPTAGDSHWFIGMIWVFSTCALFLNGWQTALHALEERAVGVSVPTAVRFMVLGVFTGSLIYCGIVIAAGSAVPWESLVDDEMPAKTAFGALTASGILGAVVLLVALVSAAKTWSAIAWIGSRLVVAQARHGFLPRSLSRVDETTGAPRRAILIVTGLAMSGPLFGRSAILPIVNMVTICLALSIILCLAVVLRRRQLSGAPPGYRVPGGVATITLALILALSMVGIAVVEPLLSSGGNFPLEWKLLVGWAALGLAAFSLTGRNGRGQVAVV